MAYALFEPETVRRRLQDAEADAAATCGASAANAATMAAVAAALPAERLAQVNALLELLDAGSAPEGDGPLS